MRLYGDNGKENGNYNNGFRVEGVGFRVLGFKARSQTGIALGASKDISEKLLEGRQ